MITIRDRKEELFTPAEAPIGSFIQYTQSKEKENAIYFKLEEDYFLHITTKQGFTFLRNINPLSLISDRSWRIVKLVSADFVFEI